MAYTDRLTRIMLEEAQRFLEQEFPGVAEVDLVIQLGSGHAPDGLLDEEQKRLSFHAMPHMPKVESLAQHPLELLWGRIGDYQVLVMAGRYHYYEGYGRGPIILPVWAAAACGARNFVFTNACGGIREDLHPGDLVIIRDHINGLGISPLAGHHHLLASPFVNMSAAYAPAMSASFRRVAAREGVPVAEGVYLANLGPQYETPAEIRAAHLCGADVVGMSTVLEVTVAHALGARVLGLALVVNLASGRQPGLFAHARGRTNGENTGRGVTRLLRRWVVDEGALLRAPATAAAAAGTATAKPA